MSKISNIFNGRRWLRNLVIAVIILAVVGGIVGGVIALTRNTDKIDDALTYKSIGWTKYGIGGLDPNGNYKSTDKSIYTKKAFECQGLNVTPEFDKDVSYEIFFYDQNNEFVHTTGRLTGAFVQDGVPFFAKYARIVITPNDDNKVTIFEKRGYAKQLNVTVYREQGFKNYTDNLFVEDYHSMTIDSSTGVVTPLDDGITAISKFINVSTFTESLMFRSNSVSSMTHLCIYLYDSSHSYLGYTNIASEMVESFTSSEGVVYYNVDFSSLGSSPEYVKFVRIASPNSNLLQVYCR